jgi:Right handed beta helix region
MRRTSLSLGFAAISFAIVLQAAPAHAQATRTWVSGVGDDANPCTRTAPCKTFAGAISKTAPSGEIDCLDPGGFGAVTITKSITIDCSGTFGSVLAALTNGININGVGITVNLRGLSINGVGNGLIGINFINGASLNLDNVNVTRFNAGSAAGILFAPSADNTLLQVNNSYITANGISPSTGGGIVVQPAVGGKAVVVISNSRITTNSDGVKANSTNGIVVMTVRDSTLSNNRGNGIVAAAGATISILVDRNTITTNFQNGVLSSGANSIVRIFESTILGNVLNGVAAAGGGVVHSYKNNAINGNVVDGTPITQEGLN